MAYYQILKQRRMDLNLSVQDVSMQTHLKPEYIRAIEDNQLDIFSDDFSYVRYFVHAYCDAIGVNWDMVSREVDDTIFAYAAARDKAMQSARLKMMESMPVARPTKQEKSRTTKRRRKKALINSAGRLSRQMHWGSDNKLAKSVVVTGVIFLAVLAILNTYLEDRSAKMLEEQKIAREKELQDKEAQTQVLAEGLKDKKNEDQPVDPLNAAIVPVTNTVNEYMLQPSDLARELEISFSVANPQNVNIYVGDSLVYSQNISGPAMAKTMVQNGSLVHIVFENPSVYDSLQVNGVTIPVDFQYLMTDVQSGVWLEITDHVEIPQTSADQESSAADAQVDTWSDTSAWQTDSYDYSQDAQSWQQDVYYDEGAYYEDEFTQ